MTTSDEYKTKLVRAHAELQALADEHVDVDRGMGQETFLTDLDALRDAAQGVWDESPLLSADWKTAYQGLSTDDIVRSVFGIGVMVGWRAASSGKNN